MCVLETKGGQNDQVGQMLLSGQERQESATRRVGHVGSHWGSFKGQFQWNSEGENMRSRLKTEERRKGENNIF